MLLFTLNAHAQSPAASGTVITIAGTGAFGFIGDGGPATNATFHFPYALAIGPDGTLYVSDFDNLRIRAIAPATGIIKTVAGNGSFGDTGNNGPATNAPLGTVIGLAVDRARHVLYLPEIDNYWVRQVNLTSGIISNFAGVGASYPFLPVLGQRGDGGPATGAWLSGPPTDIAVDGAGNVYIAEGCRIRKVDIATGIIHTMAGKSDPHTGGMSDICLSAGDGGPASEATFGYPYSLTVDAAGNVFVMDIAGQSSTSTNLVRRIDAATGIITRIAGGGTNVPGTGPATNMNLGDQLADLAVSDSGTLYIATVNQVFQMDLATGQLTPFAGGTNAAFSGDGGPALTARFNSIAGLTLAPGGGLVISDSFNQRIRYVVPDSINLTNDSGQTAFHLPWVNALTSDLTIANNPNLTNVDAGSLTTVGGSLTITSNTSAVLINMAAIGTVSGSVTIDDNTAAGVINMSSLTTVSGNLDLSGNIAAGGLDLGSLTNAGGVVNMADNTSAGSIDLGSLVSAGGITITSNTTATVIDMSSVTTVSGSINISGNNSAGGLDLGSLTNVGGAINMADNTSAGSIDLGSLVSAGGVTITSNPSAVVIGMSSLTTVSGGLDISGNSSADAIDMSSLTTVSGDLTIASNAPNAHVNLNSLTNYGCGSNEVTMTLEGGTFELTNGLTLCTNATLAGSSTVDGSVTNNGTIEPGMSPGRINITGGLVLASNSKLRLEIGGFAPSQFDFVNVAGPVTLGGTLAVSLINSFPSGMTNGASFTVLAAPDPSGLTGSFANVASGGTLTTSDGCARFTVLYAGETTVRLTGLVIVDTDSDGLPDWWEDQFSLSKTNAADATLDLDGDGASNADEHRAGTIPNNAASVFRIVSVQRENNNVRLTWSVVSGKSYHVQTNGSVADPFADLSPLITVPGTGETTTNLLDSGAATNAAVRNYRVRLAQ